MITPSITPSIARSKQSAAVVVGKRPTPRRTPTTTAVRWGAVCAVSALLASTGLGCSNSDGAASSTTAPAAPTSTRPALVSSPPATPPVTEPATTVPAPTAPPPTEPPTTAPPTTLPPIPRQPLTGVPLADGEVALARPALVVKIDNAPGARRNHTGLGSADIVFEEIVEANITRFAAVFQSQDAELVGPIRSGRSQDVDMLTALRRPLFAWSGGNPGVEKLIASSSLVDLNWQAGGRGYFRGPGTAPHNLYNSTARLWEQTPADSPGAPPPQFQYVLPGEVFTGDPVGGLDLQMRGIGVAWRWDAASGRFMRSQAGAPHVDRASGQIAATNVVVFAIEYKPSKIDTRSPEAQTLSESGPAWVFSNGQVRNGRWLRTDPTQPFHLIDDAGNDLLLTPGNTWVELAEAMPSGDPSNPLIKLELVPAT